MTGTVTIVGRGRGIYHWDTDQPVTVEEARLAFRRAIRAGGSAFDTTEQPGKKIHVPTSYAPGKEDEPKDVTVVPPFAGGV
jgi:hypothetical protein